MHEGGNLSEKGQDAGACTEIRRVTVPSQERGHTWASPASLSFFHPLHSWPIKSSTLPTPSSAPIILSRNLSSMAIREYRMLYVRCIRRPCSKSSRGKGEGNRERGAWIAALGTVGCCSVSGRYKRLWHRAYEVAYNVKNSSWSAVNDGGQLAKSKVGVMAVGNQKSWKN